MIGGGNYIEYQNLMDYCKVSVQHVQRLIDYSSFAVSDLKVHLS